MERGKTKDIIVESIPPMSVALEIGYDPADLKTKSRYKTKKEYGIVIAEEWINSGRVHCPPRYTKYFQSMKKRDDLSDSLLLGVAYAGWVLQGHNYLNKMKST
jgi:hypothetical protein